MTFDLKRARELVWAVSERKIWTLLERTGYGGDIDKRRERQAITEICDKQFPSAIAEIERLRGFETAARDLNNDLTRIAGERDDLAAQIQEMQAELVRVNQLREIEIDQAGAAERIYLEAARLKDTRIQELEDALVEERVIGEGGFRAGQCEFWYIEDLLEESCMELDGLCDWAKCPRKHELCDVAYQQLAEEGKIGPDAKPRVWQITEERKAAIKELSELLTAIGCPSCHYYIQKNYGEDITVLRVMLEEAGQE